jgi:hypothetical protein
MAQLVLASTYFATAWIGRKVKHKILAEHLKYLSKRMGEVPVFIAYSIAVGIKHFFSRFGKWTRSVAETNSHISSANTAPVLPGFASFL